MNDFVKIHFTLVSMHAKPFRAKHRFTSFNAFKAGGKPLIMYSEVAKFDS